MAFDPNEPKKLSDPPPQHLIGYARVSTKDQNLQMQIDALMRAGVAYDDIFQEKISGASKKRPQYIAMMKDIRPGDVVLVYKLDRLSRTAMGLHNSHDTIRAKGAHLRILDNSGLDTTTAAGRLMFGVLAVMAEFEREIGLERSAEGLARARAAGRFGGKKALHSDEVLLEAGKDGMKPGARKVRMSLSGFKKAFDRAKKRKAENFGGIMPEAEREPENG